MMQPIRSQSIVFDGEPEERAEGTKAPRRFTAFKNQVARTGPELVLKGIKVSNYRRNPVLQWAHSRDIPIGRVRDLKKTDDALIVEDFEFLAGDPFAERVENAWDRGVVRAASVAWLPLESERVESDDEADSFFFPRWRDVKSDLLEISLVPVPADPDALRDAFLRAICEDMDVVAPEQASVPNMIDTIRGLVATARLNTDWLTQVIEPIVRKIMAEREEPAPEPEAEPVSDLSIEWAKVRKATNRLAELIRQR